MPRDELLPSEPRIYGHYKHQLDVGKYIVEAAERCRRIQGNSGLDPLFLDTLYRTVEMRRCLGVHGYIV